MKAKSVQFHKHGPASVLKLEDVDIGKPKKGEALVRHTAIGLNYIDTYQRSGLYPMPLPSGTGTEAAGVVEAVGAGVKHVKAGDRVAYAGGAPGAYSEARVMDAGRLVKVPNGISDEEAAAMMLKGMTVEYLIRRTYKVKKGETVLFHAAAGGVGLIAGQWLKALGVTAIGTAGHAAVGGLDGRRRHDDQKAEPGSQCRQSRRQSDNCTDNSWRPDHRRRWS